MALETIPRGEIMQYQPLMPYENMSFEQLLVTMHDIWKDGALRMHAQDRELNKIKNEVESRGFCVVVTDNEEGDGFTVAIGIPTGVASYDFKGVWE